MLVSSLMTVPSGHSQPGEHGFLHKEMGLVQVPGQAEAHLVRI